MLKLKSDRPNPLGEEVEFHFRSNCPENRSKQKSFYRVGIHRINDWLGPLAAQRLKKGGLTRLEKMVLTAGEASLIIEASNFRAWSKSESLVWYQRGVFLRALTLGLGAFFANDFLLHSTKNTRWQIFSENGAGFFGDNLPVFRKSNIRLPLMNLEQAIFMHLFPKFLQDTSEQMAIFAVVSSFADEPDPENPVTQSLRRAVRKVYRRTQEPIDTHLLRTLLSFHPALIDELGEGALLPPETDGDQNDDETGDSPATPGGKLVAESKADRVARVVASAMTNGDIQASCRGAPFHAMSGVPCVVWDVGVRNLANKLETITEEELLEIFVENGWVHVVEDGSVAADLAWFVAEDSEGVRKKRATVRLAPLTEQGIAALLPKGGIPDNPALALPDDRGT